MSNALVTSSTGRVLVVDDTPANLNLLAELLEPQGYEVFAASSGALALELAERAQPDVILLDVLMPGLDGFETCRRLKTAPAPIREIPVLFISAHTETDSLVEGFRAGGVDYITKPFQAEEVLIRVETQIRLSRLAREIRDKNRALEERTAELSATNERLRQEMDRRARAEDALQAADGQLLAISDREAEHWGIAGFVGRSATIRRILDDIHRLRNFASVNVLITGESGTGKELVARAIHFQSTRARGPFLPVNCVAIPEELAESMLFGHVKGAFTGATMDRPGYFEMAHGGTLFLDEVGDMPVALQAKLLRVLEDGKVTPLGSTRERTVDVRIVAATNVDPQDRIVSGLFREDLFFRLAQFTVNVPPLRQRREDIPLLAEHFLRVFATEMGIAPPRLGRGVAAALAAHAFPGNIRELKNIIERALIESGGEDVGVQHLQLGRTRLTAPTSDAPTAQSSGEVARPVSEMPLNLEAAETLLIKRALAETNGNIAEAARKLGVNRTRIYRKLSESNE